MACVYNMLTVLQQPEYNTKLVSSVENLDCSALMAKLRKKNSS